MSCLPQGKFEQAYIIKYTGLEERLATRQGDCNTKPGE